MKEIVYCKHLVYPIRSYTFIQTSHLPTYMPPPCSNWPTFVFMCYSLRFCTMSSVLYSSMSSLMLSSNLFLSIPLLPFLCILLSSWWCPPLPSFLNKWPCHLSRFCLTKVVIGSMLASFQMPSLLMRSVFVLPPARLRITTSVLWSFCLSYFLTAQHSDPDTFTVGTGPSPSFMLSSFCGVGIHHFICRIHL